MVRLHVPLLLVFAGCAGTGDGGKYAEPTDPQVTRPVDTAVDSEDSGDSGDTADSGDTSETGDSDSGTTQTDFDLLGGDAAINAVIDAFLANVAADGEVNWMFANADLAAVKVSLHDQISQATGGPAVYTGPDMKSLHANMGITNAQFMAVVMDLLKALDTLGVPYTAGTFDGDLPADRLITALAGMQTDIVTDPDGSTILFNQLGGHGAISAVVDQFVTNVGGDSNINWMFANTDLANLKKLLVEQICDATGGYCTYSGRDMTSLHANMGITDAQFGSMVQDLLAAFDTYSVPYSPAFDQGLPGDQLILALAGLKSQIVTDADGSAVLFNQLGGHAAITQVVTDFVGFVAADSVVNARFASTDIPKFEALLVEQVCDATGGYCTYSGKDMLTAHTGMNITDSEFDAVVADFLLALDKNNVSYTANTFDGGLPADTLIQALGGMRGDIVGH